MAVRRHESRDQAARRIHAEAFKRPDRPEGDARSLRRPLGGERRYRPSFLFVAMADDEVVGHVTASNATVGAHPLSRVGPVGVLAGRIRAGATARAMMNALLDDGSSG